MSRIDNREADERSLIAILPGLNDDAREKVFIAMTHSRRWSKDAYGKAKAAVMGCRQAELPVPVASPARFSLVDFANGLLRRGK
jgi:hypothetical protein